MELENKYGITPLATDMSNTNTEFTVKDSSGNTAIIRSFSNEYAAALKKVIADLEAFRGEVGNDQLNQKKLAFVDYRVEDNQAAMPANVYFMVPVNSTGQFVEFDPTTGKPKNPQTDSSVTNTKVAKYIIMYKDTGGTVSQLGEIDQQPDFALFATLAGNNVFTGSNTFNQDITIVAGSTQDVTTIADTTAVAGKVAKGLDTRIKAIEEEKPSFVKVSFSESGAPEADSMAANTLYFYTAAQSAIEDPE